MESLPQGSILGPLLFLLYINNFRLCLKNSEQIMFANDTSVFIKEKNIHKLFKKSNNELSRIDQWLIANKLSINTFVPFLKIAPIMYIYNLRKNLFDFALVRLK